MMNEIESISTVNGAYFFSSDYDYITESEKKGVTWYVLWKKSKIVAEINGAHVVSVTYKRPIDGPIPF